MDINSFVTGFSMGKKKGGSGGGSAVLTELTVTENGVYDEPVIEGDKTITWDGVIGDRTVIVQDQEKGIVLVKVSDRILTATDLLGSVAVISMGMTMTITEDMLEVYPEATFVNFTIISISDAETFGAPETGTYFLHMGGDYVQSLTLASAPSTPADGWSKVTVNVAGDIIDVPELPTENIEEGKIYRVAEESARVYVNLTADGMVGYMDEQLGGGMTMEYLVVDELPETMKESSFGQHFAVYFVRGVWEPMVNMMGQVGSLVTMLGASFMGTVVDTSECTEEGVYTHLAATFAYGIPNPNGDMTIYQHNAEWENMTEKVGKLEAETTVLTEEVTSLRTSNETLEQKVYETEPYANFAQYAEVAAYESGLLYVKSFNAPTGSGNRYRVKIPDYICTIAVESFRYKDDVTEPWEITELEGGTGLRNIGNYAFHGQTQLRKIVLPSVVSIGKGAFQNCRNIDQCDLPDNLEEIGEEAFYSAFRGGSMGHLIIPASVQFILDNAFKACTKLTSVTFNGTPKALFATVFNGCTNLTDIYVPWAEGAVEGAPWGATNATIHYNHTT